MAVLRFPPDENVMENEAEVRAALGELASTMSGGTCRG